MKAQNGLTLPEPSQFSYTTSAYLAVTQMLPEADTPAADPAAAVVATFNQPVVALGAEAAELPAGFTLAPQVAGARRVAEYQHLYFLSGAGPERWSAV